MISKRLLFERIFKSQIINTILFVGLLLMGNFSTAQEQQKTYSFRDNPAFSELTGFYSVFSGQRNIVMLGNSLTYRISWNELLERDDVANRGIGSDITEGYLNRINYVLNLKPKICFIEGGVNDLAHEIGSDEIISNLNAIIDTLKYHRIIPVLTLVTLVTNFYKDAATFNHRIKQLNQHIINLAERRKIELIDLNPSLTNGDFLRHEFALSDGIHFNVKAYLIWKKEILNRLELEKI